MGDFVIHSKYAIIDNKLGRVVEDAGIIIENNEIIAVGKYEKIKQLISGHDIYERLNHVAIPPFVNAHTHLPETLIRGISDDSSLYDWLYNNVWPFESNLTPRDAYYGTLLGMLELIESGTGGFIDQYFYVNEIEKAVNKGKMRALLCPSVFDNTPEFGSIDNTWKNVRRFLNSRLSASSDNSRQSLVSYGVGPHAPYSVPEEYLLDISEFARSHRLPVHIHINETSSEVKEFINKYNLRPIEYLNKIGFLENKILAAHGVHVSDEEKRILKKYNVTILHNPQSNLKLSSGIAPLDNFLKMGINVAIGTDGCGSNNNLDMLEEIRYAALLQKFLTGDPRVIPNNQALFLGTIAGARAMGIKNYGIAKGSVADITVLSLDAAHNWPVHNSLSNIVYSMSSNDVSDVIVNGIFLLKNKKHQTINKEIVINEVNKIVNRILSKIGK